MEDYERKYEEFWKDIVEKNGVVDMEQVKKELYDFSQLISAVTKIYCEITGGLVSKPLTDTDIVLLLYEEKICREIDEAIKEDRENYERGV